MNKYLIKILIGVGIALAITLLGLAIFSIILTFTNISEKTIEPVIIAITGISILTGSSIACISIKKQGFFNGTVVGLLYIGFLYILSSIIGQDVSLTGYSVIMIGIGIATGAIGGIVGVNLK